MNQWCLWRANQLRMDGDEAGVQRWTERAETPIAADPSFVWPVGFTRETALERVRMDATPDLPGDASDFWIVGALNTLLARGDHPRSDVGGDVESKDDADDDLWDDDWNVQDDEVRGDDFGYNPYRNHGKFAPGPHKAAAHVERAGAALAGAHERLTSAAAKHADAQVKRTSAAVAAKQSMKEARTAGALAKRSPTAENVRAWQGATNKAIRARAAAATANSQAAKHAALHEKAQTSHAIAQAQLHEASRAAAAPAPTGPRSIEVHPHGIGFERVHGEGTTGAVELAPTPEFHHGMGRIHGEGEHATVEPTAAAPQHKAPLGYDAVMHNGQLYYQHQVSGRSYTPEQHAERARDAHVGWNLKLTGPGDHVAGYDTHEVLSRNMIAQGQPAAIRHRSQSTGHTYTPEQVHSGEAAQVERFIHEESSAPAPRRGILSRLKAAVGFG